MVLENREESRLIAYVCDALVVKIVQALDKGVRPSEGSYQSRLVMRDKTEPPSLDVWVLARGQSYLQRVLPYTGLKSLGASVLQGANACGVRVGALERVLVSKSLIEVLGLKEPDKAGIRSIGK